MWVVSLHNCNTQQKSYGCEEDQYAEEQELVVCYCIVFFCVLSFVVREFVYDLLQDCAEDGDDDEREGFNLSFDLEMVAFYLQTKNY